MMSLPESLTTDCGGLLNRRSPGRKCCCHTGLFTRDIMFTFHTDCSCPELSNYRIVFFTRSITEGHGVLSRDLSFGPTDQREVICELSNFSSHGESRRVSGFCHETCHLERLTKGNKLSNCRISFHTESHGGFLCHETCSLSRICELVFFTRNVTDGRGGYEGGTIEA